MFEHFWPRIDAFWNNWHAPGNAEASPHSGQVTKSERDNEFRCWNCGEYIDIHSEICPNCGHSPDPVIEDFSRKTVV